MIPNSVFEGVKNARFENHGADLVRGEKTFSLSSRGDGYVKATVFVRPTREELDAWEAKGYCVSTGTDPKLNEKYPQLPVRPPLAWKAIKLSDVPDSTADEWDCWDEY